MIFLAKFAVMAAKIVVENAVDALLKGMPVELASTKAIGCSIKK